MSENFNEENTNLTEEDRKQIREYARLIREGSKNTGHNIHALFNDDGTYVCAEGAVLVAIGKLEECLQHSTNHDEQEQAGYNILKEKFPIRSKYICTPAFVGSLASKIWAWNEEMTREEIANRLEQLAEG